MKKNVHEPLSSIDFEETPGGLTVLRIKNSLAEACVSLHGGQVLTWRPLGEPKDVLWLSPLATYVPQRAIRGGVPICWPWFGAHAADGNKPAHGYARLLTWTIVNMQTLTDGSTRIQLQCPQGTPLGGPDSIGVTIQITVGTALEIDLTTTNNGSAPISYSEGLHTYLYVEDSERVTVRGLSGLAYLDLLNNNHFHNQVEDISIVGPLARLFLNTDSECILDDPLLRRRIRVRKSGSRSTAVWNPALAAASKMDDLGSVAWRTMVCVESANALSDAITLLPAESHTMSAVYLVER